MKRLIRPSDSNPEWQSVLRAVIRLKGNTDWERVMKYLLDDCDGVIVQRLKVQAQPIQVCWDQGAAQLLDDLRDISVNAAEWLGQILAKQQRTEQQKEGTGNV